jgi:transposase
MANKQFISVGIDVGADFSFMSIALPSRELVGKPYKIVHLDQHSLSGAVSRIAKAEELNSLKVRVVLESTGIYHIPLFCYLKEAGFDVIVINPLISHSNRNFNIRKVHSDKLDSKKLALLGLNPTLKTSVMPVELVLNLRGLAREYFNLVDNRASFTNKLLGVLREAFPQYLGLFSKVTTAASLKVLDAYPLPENILAADPAKLSDLIAKTARRKASTIAPQRDKLVSAAKDAQSFGHALECHAALIRLYIEFIKRFDEAANGVLRRMTGLTCANEHEPFVKQIRLLQSYRGAGFLSAVTLMCEIGDFSVFSKPKQLFAYFGIDPEVKQSGNFQGTRVNMSKRGSSLARRILYIMAVQGVANARNGQPKNVVLQAYYIDKCRSKPKNVALGAVMHKVCNIVFAMLRDNKPFEMITPQEHCQRRDALAIQAA